MFTHTNTAQLDNFTTEYGAGMLDIITLKSLRKTNDIIVSIQGGECERNADESILTCNFTNKLSTLDSEDNYTVTYFSNCDQKYYNILNRIITIKRGISLISISPEWIDKNEFNKKNITLEYNYEISGHIIIWIYRKNKPNTKELEFDIAEINKSRYLNINVSSFNLSLDLYHIGTKIGEEKFFFNDNLGFRVIEKNINFTFNHNYFVLNDNEKNYLIITANNATVKFGCIIEEDSKKEKLITNETECKEFYYKIYRVGIIKFNYYYNESGASIIIPIEKNITVVSSYSDLFTFYLIQSCYYYKFDIFLKIKDNNPSYYLFLYNENLNELFHLKNYTNNLYLNYLNYTYDPNDISYDNLINKKYTFIISETKEDKIVYLFKSNLSFTDIIVPKFIINPYTTIVFENITCNLNESRFKIIKKNSDLSTQMSNCIYYSNNSTLFCDIKYNNFYSNYPYVNYSY